jgi:hypothetical protein
MTGAISWGYQATDTGNGFGTDTAKITFAASEDLGGGLKLSGSMSLDNMQDVGGSATVDTTAAASATAAVTQTGNPYVQAKGVTLALSGGFGTLAGSSVEGGDAVALDSLLALGNGTKGSSIGYTTPSISGFTGSVTHKGGNGDIGKGNSDDGNSLMIYGIKYAQGPVAAGVSMLRWNDANQTDGAKARDVVTASYDMGVAKVGVFWASQKYRTASNDFKNTAYQLSVPMGAISLGAEYGVKTKAGAADLKGTAVSASYALSKRTSISVSAKKWDTTTVKSEDNSILLNHSF